MRSWLSCVSGLALLVVACGNHAAFNAGDGRPCGDATCNSNQLCAHETCTGGTVDAAPCALPWRCVDVPAACGAHPDCTCLSQDVCTEAICCDVDVSGAYIMCCND